MLTRSTSTPDISRVAEAVSVPGIDPRIWVSNAVVNDDGQGNAKVTVGARGYLVEVTMLPSGIVELARVGTMYNGAGFGLYFPLGSGDSGLVIAPDGSPDAGLVFIPKVWSPADPPPQDAINAPTDLHLVVKPGANLRLVVSGAGNVVLNPQGSGQVFLGGEANDSSMQPVPLGQALQNFLNTLVTNFNAHTHPVPGVTSGPSTTTSSPPTPSFDLTQPSVTATKAQVK